MMGPALREFMHDDLEAAWNGGVSQGIEIGIEQGIEQRNELVVEAIISTCKKFNGSFTDAVEMVMQNTGMDQSSAEAMVKKHWT